MLQASLRPAERKALMACHPEVFHRSLVQRLWAPVAVAVTAAYFVFCFFFFGVPQVLGDAQWERAGTYMADWVSWEATPRFRFQDDGIALEWTRSLLGDNPNPDWIVQTGPDAYTISFGDDANRIEVAQEQVVAVVGRSTTVSAHWRTPLSLLFVDGGHTDEHACNDYLGFGRWVARGGTLAIHDVFPDPDDGGQAPYRIYRRALQSGDFVEVRVLGTLRALQRVRGDSGDAVR